MNITELNKNLLIFIRDSPETGQNLLEILNSEHIFSNIVEINKFEHLRYLFSLNNVMNVVIILIFDLKITNNIDKFSKYFYEIISVYPNAPIVLISQTFKISVETLNYLKIHKYDSYFCIDNVHDTYNGTDMNNYLLHFRIVKYIAHLIKANKQTIQQVSQQTNTFDMMFNMNDKIYNFNLLCTLDDYLKTQTKCCLIMSELSTILKIDEENTNNILNLLDCNKLVIIDDNKLMFPHYFPELPDSSNWPYSRFCENSYLKFVSESEIRSAIHNTVQIVNPDLKNSNETYGCLLIVFDTAPLIFNILTVHLAHYIKKNNSFLNSIIVDVNDNAKCFVWKSESTNSLLFVQIRNSIEAIKIAINELIKILESKYANQFFPNQLTLKYMSGERIYNRSELKKCFGFLEEKINVTYLNSLLFLNADEYYENIIDNQTLSNKLEPYYKTIQITQTVATDKYKNLLENKTTQQIEEIDDIINDFENLNDLMSELISKIKNITTVARILKNIRLLKNNVEIFGTCKCQHNTDEEFIKQLELCLQSKYNMLVIIGQIEQIEINFKNIEQEKSKIHDLIVEFKKEIQSFLTLYNNSIEATYTLKYLDSDKFYEENLLYYNYNEEINIRFKQFIDNNKKYIFGGEYSDEIKMMLITKKLNENE